MSISASNAVWQMKLPSTQKLVLLAIANHANDQNICWPSMSTLAKICSISERTAQRLVADLRKNKWLKIKHRYRTDGSRTSNLYQLLIPFRGVNFTEPDVILDDSVCQDNIVPDVTHDVKNTIETLPTPPQQDMRSQGFDFTYLKKLSESQRQQLSLKLENVSADMGQKLLDELAGRMQIEYVRNPQRYFSALLIRANAGLFSSELGLQIAEARRLKQVLSAQVKNTETLFVYEKKEISLTGKKVLQDALSILGKTNRKKNAKFER